MAAKPDAICRSGEKICIGGGVAEDGQRRRHGEGGIGGASERGGLRGEIAQQGDRENQVENAFHGVIVGLGRRFVQWVEYSGGVGVRSEE